MSMESQGFDNLMAALQQDPEKHVGRAARYLGRLLAKGGTAFEDVRAFRGEVQRIKSDNDRVTGALTTLIETAASWEISIAEKVALSQLPTFSEHAKTVLHALGKQPATMNELATQLEWEEWRVSEQLSHLRAAGLLESIDLDGVQIRDRVQRLTSFGHVAHNTLKGMAAA